MRIAILGYLMLVILVPSASAQNAPALYKFEYGMGLVSTNSKTDPKIKSAGNPVAILGASLTGNRSKLNVRLEEGLDDLFTGRAVEVIGRQHGFSVKKVSIGITGYYFYGREIDTFGIDIGYLAQTLVRKHAVNVGADILYGSMNGKHLRGAYSVGAMYLWKDGVFSYEGLDKPIVKLGDWDLVPAEMVTFAGNLPVGRFELAGSMRSIRSLNVADIANTKGLVPFRHTVVDASVYFHVWKALGISISNTYSDNNRGTAFLGNMNRVNLVVKK